MVDFDYKDWLEYFASNAGKKLELDLAAEKELSAAEKKLLFPSIIAFQAGEHSEGTYLQKAAERFAKDSGEDVYPAVMEYFIKEENMHSSYLLQYMTRHGIPKKEMPALDWIFRKLRRISGIRSEVMVLVTAEIIALSYYTALGNASESKALKHICRRMLHDELPHVIFQSYTLAHFKNCPVCKAVRVLLMEGSCLLVWLAYGPVFRAGGYDFTKLLSESLGYLRQSMTLADKRNI